MAAGRKPNPRPSDKRFSLRLPLALAGLVVLVSIGWWAATRREGGDDNLQPSDDGLQPTHDGTPSWSPDGTKIAFYSNRDGNDDLYVMNADGTNPVRMTNTPTASEGYPTWSPDGRRIAFDSDLDGNYEIYVMDADGTNIERMTEHPANDVSASWSPDGSKIVFMSNRTGSFQVFMMDADGMNLEQITYSGSKWFPMFSPDGKRLTFHDASDVFVLDLETSETKRLTTTPDNGMFPQWSPDVERMVFMSSRDGGNEIYVMNADGSDPTRITHTDEGDLIDPRFSPDGLKIVYVHLPNGKDPGPKFIYVMNADGTNRVRLSP